MVCNAVSIVSATIGYARASIRNEMSHARVPLIASNAPLCHVINLLCQQFLVSDAIAFVVRHTRDKIFRAACE